MWKARNALYFREEKWEEKVIIEHAWEEWIEWKKVRLEETNSVMKRVQIDRQTGWARPEQGVIKFNVGPEIQEGSHNIGVGIVARDFHGEAVQMWSVAREGKVSPVVADLLAVRIALLFAQQNGWREIEIQVDTKALAD